MNRAELLALFERALREKGMKPAAASKAATGNPYVIRNMTRPDGQITVPNFENLQSLCDVLGLEFYIGPKRNDHFVQDVNVQGVSVNEVRSVVNDALDRLLEDREATDKPVSDASMMHAEEVARNVRAISGYAEMLEQVRDQARRDGINLSTEELMGKVLTMALGRNIYSKTQDVDTPND